MKFVSLFSFAYMIFLIWCVFLMSFNGHLPFGMKVSSAGLFIEPAINQFICCKFHSDCIWIVSMRKEKYAASPGMLYFNCCNVCSRLYGDLLHRMSSVQEAMELLTKRTLIIFAAVVISLTMAKLLQPKQPFQ